jgi:hypothetical protein
MTPLELELNLSPCPSRPPTAKSLLPVRGNGERRDRLPGAERRGQRLVVSVSSIVLKWAHRGSNEALDVISSHS